MLPLKTLQLPTKELSSRTSTKFDPMPAAVSAIVVPTGPVVGAIASDDAIVSAAAANSNDVPMLSVGAPPAAFEGTVSVQSNEPPPSVEHGPCRGAPACRFAKTLVPAVKPLPTRRTWPPGAT